MRACEPQYGLINLLLFFCYSMFILIDNLKMTKHSGRFQICTISAKLIIIEVHNAKRYRRNFIQSIYQRVMFQILNLINSDLVSLTRYSIDLSKSCSCGNDQLNSTQSILNQFKCSCLVRMCHFQ